MPLNTVWHVGANPSPHTVNGVNQAVWALARAQVAQGCSVAVVARKVRAEDRIEAHSVGIQLLSYQDAFSARSMPAVVHLHSVFMPQHAALAWLAKVRKAKIVTTPHGGLMPDILGRHGRSKRFYHSFVERPRLRLADRLVAVSEPEAEDIQRFAGVSADRIRVIPNAVEPPSTEPTTSTAHGDHVVYLGRLESHWKGIDRVISLAAARPDLSFGLYGRGEVEQPLPANVHIRKPVYGEAKSAVISASRVLVQLSRWEVFGMSVVEAMLLGTNVMVSDEMYLSSWVADSGGFVFNSASQLEDNLAVLDSAVACTDRGRELASAAKASCSPAIVARETGRLYSELRA